MRQLEELVLKYPQIPFVLCHCGLPHKKDYNKQWKLVAKLLQSNTNLFADISYKSAEFFLDNPLIVNLLPNKFIIGSDINVKCCKLGKQKEDMQRFTKLQKLNIQYKNTLKNIFKL